VVPSHRSERIHTRWHAHASASADASADCSRSWWSFQSWPITSRASGQREKHAFLFFFPIA